MSEPTATDIAKANEHGDRVAGWASGMMTALQKQIPDAIEDATRSRLAQVAITEMRKNPELARCAPASVMGALLKAHSLGLPIGTGEFWLIPYGGNVEGQLGYQGWLTLIRRHANLDRLVDRPVYENEEFSIDDGATVTFNHKRILDPNARGDLLGVYCVGIVNGSWTAVEWMHRDEIDAHVRRYVKSKRGPWSDELSKLQMARKTVVIRWAKRQPMPDDARTFLARSEAALFATIDATRQRPDGSNPVGSLLNGVAGSENVDAPPFDDGAEEGAA